MILTTTSRLIFIREFERICRGEISLTLAGEVLRLSPSDQCLYLAFEHGRVCVVTVRVFPTHSTSFERHSSLFNFLFLSFHPFLCCSFMGFTSSTWTEALRSIWQRWCSCDLMSNLPLGHITPSHAWSSPIVAFTLRGKTQGVGMTSLCTKTGETL